MRAVRGTCVTLQALAEEALTSIEALLAQAIASVRARVSENGRLSAALIEREQRAAHGLAWLATYVEAVREMTAYARRMRAEGRFGDTERLLTLIGLGEYIAQIFGGIPMSQGEILRLADFAHSRSDFVALVQSYFNQPPRGKSGSCVGVHVAINVSF